MKPNLPNRSNWAQRLDDWEQSAPARPGEGPGRVFWEQLSAELAPPPRRRRPPLWLWSVLGLLLLTHFIAYHPGLGAFPLPGTRMVAERAALDRVAETAAAPGPTKAEAPAVEKEEKRRGDRKMPATIAVPEPTIPPPPVALASTPAERLAVSAGRTDEVLHPTTTEPLSSSEPVVGTKPVESNVRVEATAKPPHHPEIPPVLLTACLADTTFRIRYSARAKIPVPLPQYPVADPSSFAAPGGKLRVSVGGHYAPVSNRTRLTIDPGVLTARRTRESRVPEWGLNLYLGLGPHWGLRTGLTTTRLQTESQYRFIRFFNPQREAPDPTGDGLSKYDVEVASAYAKSSAEVELLRPRDQLLQSGARLRIDLRLRETVALRSIPLQITYANAWGRFGLEAQLGPEWNHSEVVDFAAAATVQVAGLRAERVRIQSREQISRGSYWSLAGGLAATYWIGRRWQVGLIPEFTTSLENLSARPEFSASSRSAGVRLETRYRLGGK